MIRPPGFRRKGLTFLLKCPLDAEMKTKTVALSLGLILAAAALYAANPMEGTWKLNESKSKLTRGTTKNTKVVYDSKRLGMGRWDVTGEGLDADGKPVHSEWKGKFDGKDYEVTGDPNSDMRSYTKVNDQTLNITVKKGGKVTATGRIAVSADGKSRVVTLSGTTAKGKKFSNTAVYDKG
jgi:polyisoprenoid-binding protein YceI